MPAAIGIALLGEALAGTTLLGSLTLGTVVGSTVLGGAVLGLSLLLSDKVKTSAGQQQVRQSLPARTRGYGRAKLGGAVFFFEMNGPTLAQGLIHAEGPIDGYDAFWLNDQDSGISGGLGGANQVKPWTDHVIVETRLGTDDQPASALLQSLFPGVWTSAHRLAGLAYSVVRYNTPKAPAKNFQRFFPNGAPSLRVVARLARVLDPRSGQTAWSDNPALCILDYLTSDRGMTLPQSRIDVASFAAFADLCDEPVPTRTGGTIPRYRCGGTYQLTDEPREVLRKLLDTCDGELMARPDGSVAIDGGRWTEPTVTLTDAAVKGYSYRQGNDRLSAYNRLKISYTEPGADYQQVEGQPWDDVAGQALDGVLVQDLTVPMVQAHPQARRLAKIRSAKDNPRHRLTLTTDMSGLLALGARTLRLTLTELGLDEDFLVTGFALAADLATCQLDVSSLSAAAYAWDAATEEGDAPRFATSTAVATVAPDPAGVAVALVRTAVSGAVKSVRARVTAAQPTTTDAAGTAQYWSLLGRYRPSGDGDWTAMTADGDLAVLSDVLSDGGAYQVEVAFAGLGSQSDWSAPIALVATADDVAPAPVSGLAGTGSSAAVTLTWTNPGSANFAAAHVYRGTTTAFADATLIAGVAGAPSGSGSFNDTGRPAGTWRYWVAAANGSGTEAAPAGPVAVTV